MKTLTVYTRVPYVIAPCPIILNFCDIRAPVNAFIYYIVYGVLWYDFLVAYSTTVLLQIKKNR